MPEIKFNLNHYVKVKISKAGLLWWKEKDDAFWRNINARGGYPIEERIKPIEWYEKKVGEDGYVKIQFWEFMKEFGEGIEFGRLPLFDTDIIIITNE